MSKTIRRRLSTVLLSAIFLLALMPGLVTPAQPASAHTATTTTTTDQSGISWPSNQQLPTFAQPHHLDVLDLSADSGDVKQLFTTLEGLINRSEPRIYILGDTPDEGKMTWLNDTHIPYTLYTDPWELMSKYAHEVKGIIIYDPNLLDTTNVATTLAGLRDGIVASPDLATKLTAAPYHLPILEDLRGKFASALDAYTWQFQNLWPQTTHRMLIGLPGGNSVVVPADNWKNFQTILAETQDIRDSSNRAIYNLDLSNQLGGQAVYLRFQDAFPSDGWGPSVHQVTVTADGQVIAQFTPCTAGEDSYIFDHGGSSCDTSSDAHRFADGGSYFVYRFAPPAGTKQLVVSVDMWNQYLVSASGVAPQVSSDQKEPFGLLRDYAVANRAMVVWFDMNNVDDVALFKQVLATVKPGTPYLGWFNDEPKGVTLTSSYGVYVLAADFFNNLTVFSGIQAPIFQQQQTVAAPPLQNKIYITFTVGEGDNIQYDEHYMRKNWSDPARGSVPLNWTINPLLQEAAPFILNYYQRTATANDLLIAGPSGASYFYPSFWPQDNLATYFSQSASYLRRAGLDYVNVIDPAGFPVSSSIAQAYSDQLGVRGAVYTGSTTQTTTTMVGNLPESLALFYNNQNDLPAIQQQVANWDGQSPLFLSILVGGWGDPAANAAYIVQQLGSNYVPVRADQYFQLFRQANGLPPQA